ncbi:MAG: glutamine--tRNA ligase/YqeY domain fusion protein [Rhodospirillaceae bacterium]|jgi:glutaminyl-tRNA synthetase|nr:glutamine--tRNA ligase/YqeY domain fusion protein [Rhodospirillaceae bacterium]MBT5943614.1 glutamine--tRNA ligase/YqeY domain fusion protein [Rhodospirillaceae bacterium]MBT6404642.1 glutamine--tRNA ligase/YqeY domain fusion protein [Rhodospirillaceae bacterium]MBT6535609.1 glutamine--tRNA ligase/YqeY domain fusion protein [Rhodospirillaceae bacterium]MBT7361038.1 glutamine--tRNA ligase/YqeY domain fusion protein [Rhodospirillaceae bacterium]
MTDTENPETEDTPRDFIRDRIRADLDSGQNDAIVTRFPPEPNGYLHIGHAKSICLNFGVAAEFGGTCNLRFDDTNPAREDAAYITAIQDDVRWLGFDWGENLFHASDNFEQLYAWAQNLIEGGLAYVDDLSAEEMREYRGTLTEPGRPSPHRDRTAEESLDLFARMRAGEFEDGDRVLRARIDMASGNINLRDPVLYRIIRADHPRTGDAWCIYPTYDFAHGQSDAIEHVTHSLCTLEFEDHRPLYDWLLENLPVPARPRQFEFGRLNLGHTVLSKRRLIQLVEEGHVAGWDDPRMPTVTGLRRRGVPPEAIRDFIGRLGITKADGMVEMSYLENTIREHLNQTAPRRMGVLDPIKLVIENYPEGQTEELDGVNNPTDESAGTRKVPFGRELWVERDDYMDDAPKKFRRLTVGREVRLRFAYYVTCTDVIKDADGNVTEVRCTYDPESRGGDSPDGRKVRGTIHWVSAAHAETAEVRLYDDLFTAEEPGKERDWIEDLNPASLEVRSTCYLEPALADDDGVVQFERLGYFAPDADSAPGALVFNRTVSLRDSKPKG